ncbi:MAG: GNAT family N-acetyltransferase [Candidatus Wenzhouxiangella sp. M2_3B_020]
MSTLPRLDCRPLTPERWDDFEQLFGERGACGGCWCMLWRLAPKSFEAGKGPGNRAAMKQLVEAGMVPGLLAYRNREAVGWCAVAPRADYPALARSRILKPVDDEPCWSVSCLFVARPFRRQRVSVALLRAAVDHVASRGGRILEAYPVEPRSDAPVPAAFAWTGLAGAYLAAGFQEVARRSPTRPIVRVRM